MLIRGCNENLIIAVRGHSMMKFPLVLVLVLAFLPGARGRKRLAQLISHVRVDLALRAGNLRTRNPRDGQIEATGLVSISAFWQTQKQKANNVIMFDSLRLRSPFSVVGCCFVNRHLWHYTAQNYVVTTPPDLSSVSESPRTQIRNPDWHCFVLFLCDFICLTSGKNLFNCA